MVHSVVVSAQADVQRTFNPCGALAKPDRKPEDVSTGHDNLTLRPEAETTK
ncbi:hypothetical protein [Enterobacter ludwigii]|uniref:hypothetical protein n=1 Tax=Enterobacter ludwigii TaxID=299767 RepID=UPI0013D013E0|nr:hypothetical protein [Enterobacter ludwigii]